MEGDGGGGEGGVERGELRFGFGDVGALLGGGGYGWFLCIDMMGTEKMGRVFYFLDFGGLGKTAMLEML